MAAPTLTSYRMSQVEPLFTVLRQTADSEAVGHLD